MTTEKKYNYGHINKSIEQSDIESLEKIFKEQPKLLCEEYNGDHDTPLHFCAEKGSLEVCEYLLKKGLDINVSLKGNETALNEAASVNRLDIAKWLLDNGAFVDGTDTVLLSPMMSAVYFDHYEMVKMLVEYGANVNRMHIRNGRLPLDIALSRKYENIAEYLKSQGAKSRYILPDWVENDSEGSGILGYITLTAGEILPVDIAITNNIVQKLAIVNNEKNRMLFTFGLFKLHQPSIELFIVLPEYWNFYIKTNENQFPILLLSRLADLVKDGLKIEEGYQILANDPKYSDLAWLKDLAGFFASNLMWKSKTGKNEQYNEAALLSLIPINKTRNGFAKQSVEKNREAGWTKITLNI